LIFKETRMKFYKVSTVFCIVMLLNNLIVAQVLFEQDDHFSQNYAAKSLIAAGMVDINGDGFDDIVRVKDGNALEVIYVTNEGSYLHPVVIDDINVNDAWSMAVANLDNGLKNDILLARAFKDLQIISTDNKDELYLRQSVANKNYSQSSTMADINGDGWLDLFICSDDSESLILKNNGSGEFVKDNSLIDLNTSRPSDNSGNYGSEWMDIDSDGDLDLYISKCKAGVNNPNDPRRINMLYVNDGHNNYTENAEAFDLNFGQQSWASSFGDLDNDGDVDGIVIHHGAAHSLLENIDNKFVDRSDRIKSLSSEAFQVIMRDFDNNGFQDILIVGGKDYMLWNQGDFKFIVDESPMGHYDMISCAVGDVNRDGSLDILGVYGGVALNAPGVLNDILWVNNSNRNNFLNIRLHGIKSNANGVGARIRVKGDWGIQIRDVKAGESYSVSNSLNSNFGLSGASKIDHIEVTWPSGQVDKYRNLAVNTFYEITEGGCINSYKKPEQSQINLCEGQGITLFSEESALWSDMTTSTSKVVNQAGIYFNRINSEQSCIQSTEPTYVSNFAESLYTDAESYMACNGDPFIIKYGTTEYNLQQLQIDRSESGPVSIFMNGSCQSFEKNIHLVRVFADSPLITNTHDDGMITIDNDQNQINWYKEYNDVIPFHVGDTLYVSHVDATALFVESEMKIEYPPEFGAEVSHTGTNQYSGDQLSGGMYFDVLEEVIIEELTVYTDTEGERKFIIEDKNQNIVFEKMVSLTDGRNVIELQVALPAGKDYFIHTDTETNKINLGFHSPRLVRSNSNTNYPYQIGGEIKIVNSSFGPSYFMYFYNWKVRKADFICRSERLSVNIVQDTSVDTEDDILTRQINIYPNPTSDYLTIDIPEDYKLQRMALINAQGQTQALDLNLNVNLSEYTTGVYVLELGFENHIVRKQVIVE